MSVNRCCGNCDRSNPLRIVWLAKVLACRNGLAPTESALGSARACRWHSKNQSPKTIQRPLQNCTTSQLPRDSCAHRAAAIDMGRVCVASVPQPDESRHVPSCRALEQRRRRHSRECGLDVPSDPLLRGRRRVPRCCEVLRSQHRLRPVSRIHARPVQVQVLLPVLACRQHTRTVVESLLRVVAPLQRGQLVAIRQCFSDRPLVAPLDRFRPLLRSPGPLPAPPSQIPSQRLLHAPLPSPSIPPRTVISTSCARCRSQPTLSLRWRTLRQSAPPGTCKQEP